VPISALIEADDRRAFVYTVDGRTGIARKVAVGIGRFVGEQVEITSGIESGAPVVIDGAAFLHDGARVRIQ
jgi:multidrug efflux pump subunit AcrA (membrane-fusion protein)